VQWLSVAEAAGELDLSNQRVRQLIDDGQLRAHRLGGRWLVDVDGVARRAASRPLPGRPWAPARAWALLSLAADRPAAWLPLREIRRLERMLVERSLGDLAGHLGQRAHRHSWYVHPALLDDLLAEEGVVISGARASVRLRDRGADDIYVHPGLADDLRHRYAPDEDPGDANLIARVVRGPWPFLPGERRAWTALAAVDLLERDDSRSRRAAEEMLADA
jgi:excisionase family DNA binding protein